MIFFQSFFETLTFLLSVLISFYLPGKLLSNTLGFNLNFLEKVFYSTTLGLVIFTLIAYVLSWVKLEVLLLPILLIISLISVKESNIKIPKLAKNDKSYILILIFFTLIFSLPLILNGQLNNTLRLFGVNAVDSMWHISLINELKYHFPPDNPGFSGVPLVGYHFFFNFVLAKLNSAFGTPVLSLYFHFFPVLTAFLWSIGVYVLTFKWTNSRRSSLWAVFLTIFGGSFAFILKLQGHPGSLDDAFGMTQPYSSLLNPPLAISIVLIIATLFSICQYLKTKQNGYLMPIILFAGIITMFKVYAGIIVLGGVIFLSIIQLRRKNLWLPICLFFSLILFYLTYWIFRDPSSKLLFDPLWSPHKVLIDNLPWYNYSEKFYTYSRVGVKHGILEIESFALLVFILGNLGTRLIGLILNFFFFIKSKKFPSDFALTLLSMLAISLIIPMFFIQSGKVFEIIQMTWYFLFFSALLAADGFGKFFSLRFNKSLKVGLIFIVVIATLPSMYEKINSYLLLKNGIVSPLYFDAAKFLQSQGTYDSTLLEVPSANIGKPLDTTDEDALSWYMSTSTPRFIALSNKRGFLNNEGINFIGTDFQLRVMLLASIAKYENAPGNYFMYQPQIQDGFKKYKIVYIYSPYRLIRLEKTLVTNIFKNQEAYIYKVNTK